MCHMCTAQPTARWSLLPLLSIAVISMAAGVQGTAAPTPAPSVSPTVFVEDSADIDTGLAVALPVLAVVLVASAAFAYHVARRDGVVLPGVRRGSELCEAVGRRDNGRRLSSVDFEAHKQELAEEFQRRPPTLPSTVTSI